MTNQLNHLSSQSQFYTVTRNIKQKYCSHTIKDKHMYVQSQYFNSITTWTRKQIQSRDSATLAVHKHQLLQMLVPAYSQNADIHELHITVFTKWHLAFVNNVFYIGADPVGVQGSDPTKIWFCGLLWLGAHKNFTERNLISLKSTPEAAL